MHPNVTTLRAVYADLSRIGDHVSEDVVLHAADGRRYAGRSAVMARELDLVGRTTDTLVMDVEHIVANDHFGVVLGVLRAHRDGGKAVAMPFCGLWRFRDRVIVEHWENDYDPTVLPRILGAAGV
jgi:ketosteroid isomerase-like protein